MASLIVDVILNSIAFRTCVTGFFSAVFAESKSILWLTLVLCYFFVYQQFSTIKRYFELERKKLKSLRLSDFRLFNGKSELKSVKKSLKLIGQDIK